VIPKPPHIEVIIPLFNEAETLPVLLAQMDHVRASLGGQATLSYLFINDGSTDRTGELLKTLHHQRGDIRVVELLHNFGHSAALACGIDHFQGDLALFMDGDLQDSPAALPHLLSEWRKGAETVVVERAERMEKQGYLFKTFYFLLRKSASQVPPINFGTHCLLDKTVVRRMKAHTERHRYFPALVAYSSKSIRSVSLPRGERFSGNSRVGLFGLIHLACTAFMSFSSAPIRLVSLIGFICSIGSLMGASIIVSIKLLTTWAIPGWASTMSLLFFASGIQLLCLGILGEYVARIFDEVKKRPLYWVSENWEIAPKSRESLGATHRPVSSA